MVVSDFVPVDMVANAMIVAMVTHAKQHNFGVNNIYQVGSSLRNPIKSGAFFNYCFEHFTKKSWNNNNNENVSKITFLNSMDSFYKQMATRTRSFKVCMYECILYLRVCMYICLLILTNSIFLSFCNIT